MPELKAPAAHRAAGAFNSGKADPDPKSTAPAPEILGYHITNLYDFFMVFVVSAAAAAAILFLISGKLAKMMDARNYPAPVAQV